MLYLVHLWFIDVKFGFCFLLPVCNGDQLVFSSLTKRLRLNCNVTVLDIGISAALSRTNTKPLSSFNMKMARETILTVKAIIVEQTWDSTDLSQELAAYQKYLKNKLLTHSGDHKRNNSNV